MFSNTNTVGNDKQDMNTNTYFSKSNSYFKDVENAINRLQKAADMFDSGDPRQIYQAAVDVQYAVTYLQKKKILNDTEDIEKVQNLLYIAKTLKDMSEYSKWARALAIRAAESVQYGLSDETLESYNQDDVTSALKDLKF